MRGAEILPRVDHIIVGTPDLDLGIREMEARLGVRAVPGGRHADLGTCNALIAFGGACYLEIVAPDPEQPEMAGRRVFDVDRLDAPRLLTWVARGRALDQLAARAGRESVDLGAVRSGGRTRPDGTFLAWQVTDPYRMGLGGIQPFFIDWGESPHPGDATPSGCTLLALEGRHPDVAEARRTLDVLGLPLPIREGEAPSLVARLETPGGEVTLT